MNKESIGPEELTQHGLTAEEFSRLKALLGREPNHLELGMFSVMWSEHCSYKSSKVHLRRLPTEGPRVIQGPGENAGVVDIGDGLVAVFKIESHNHPSYIEPFQGAATGVGGILRDIFTMGARPMAFMNSLRFGTLSVPKNRFLFEGVVAGIAGYGNCVGIPTVGGEIYFNEIYDKNPLVNAFCLGVAKREDIVRARASGVGNAVVYIGSRTGRDGIHGATMASEAFGKGSEEKRPTVQVGDPFLAKLLMEASLEMIRSGIVEGIQDMGAGGLTGASAEMAGRAGTGITLELSSVPLREGGMTPYEIMLSESQERMLLVTHSGHEERVLEICRKWDLDGAIVGRVTNDGTIRVTDRGLEVASVPPRALTDEAPQYERPMVPPPYLEALQTLQTDILSEPTDYNRALLGLLSTPTIASKQWVYQQYDHMVRTNTVLRPGPDAAVIKIKGTRKALAMTVDCNSLYTLLNPYRGGAIAVSEAARNLVCVGAEPIGMTDCLNFASPEKPDVMWQFAAAIEGITDACRALEIPVVSGNVSFYNETNGIGIYPTPVVGMVGLIEDEGHIMTPWFKDEGDWVVMLGQSRDDIGGTEYLKLVHSRETGIPPLLNLEEERSVQVCCLEAIRTGIINSAHDCSEGGLAVTLAECCFMGPLGKKIGAGIQIDTGSLRGDSFWFGESQSRIVVTVEPHRLEDLRRMAESRQVPVSVLGQTGGEKLTIKQGSRTLMDLSLEDLERTWREAIPRQMSGEFHVG
jgi:phosphoribosylformylglycinamidine synthase subunit PurL